MQMTQGLIFVRKLDRIPNHCSNREHYDVWHPIYIRFLKVFPHPEAGDIAFLAQPMASWHICLGLEGIWHGQWPSLEAELKDPVLLGLARSRIWGWLGLLVNECKDMFKKQKKQCIRFYDQCLMLFACPTFWPRHVLVVLGL